MKKELLLASLLILASATSQADDSSFALGLTGGTTGYGLSGTFKMTESLNLRAVYTSFDDTDSVTESGINYNFTYDIGFTSLLLDWHPMDSSFRLSTGLADGGIKVSGIANATSGNYNIGGTTYTAAAAGTVNATVEYDSVAPYFGIGWGNAVNEDGSFTFSLDLGVVVMDDPTTDITATGAVAAADLTQEEQELKDALDSFELYPVFNLGLHYKF